MWLQDNMKCLKETNQTRGPNEMNQTGTRQISRPRLHIKKVKWHLVKIIVQGDTTTKKQQQGRRLAFNFLHKHATNAFF